MKQAIVVGTANADKLKELRLLLKDLRIRVIPVFRLGPVPKVHEDGRTFAENAAKKARIYSRLSDHLTLADDSGLCVHALNGKPGVYSARFAGPGCTYMDNNQKLLKLLGNKPKSKRKAYFCCTIALYHKGHMIKILKRVCRGTIAEGCVGKRGFGFDPVFIPQGRKTTFAQMSSRDKNKISHRGLALKEAKKFIRTYFKSSS